MSTPMADALMRVTATANGSLHALPLSGGHSLAGSALRGKYTALLGEEYLAAEVSYSGVALDSFFRPRGCIAEAQRLAAAAFGADATQFVTCGTTLANAIGLDALIRLSGSRSTRALVDRSSHQSVHFALDRPDVDTVYCAQRHDPRREQSWADIDDLVARFASAAALDAAFDVVVLSSAGYDGSRIDVHSLLTELFRYTDTLTVLVDEAWSAVHYFHPDLRVRTALAAAGRVRAEHPGKRLRMLVTHSAHKSMSSLRQGSYLHVLGDEALREATRAALYRLHTTSPSLPVLASLDLARAQGESEGAALVERSLGHARTLRDLVRTDPRLEPFDVLDPAWADARWMCSDPTKLLLGVDPSVISPEDLQVRLMRDHGLYIARAVRAGLLLHLHIGVTAEVFERFVAALRTIAVALAPTPPQFGDSLPRFVIAYPPGIPVSVPGEWHDDAACPRVGVELFRV
ncbi:hypothetical protein ACOBQX_23050 [Actinokineospora sp. G85]|uniref:hypothetical protein n=1 Tax=Actinokineospora sp. G85 TaxID=3406626 RepID=UPI003C73A779